MPKNRDSHPRRSALLVIDAQDSFRVGPRWERRNNRDFERNIAALVDAYRTHGLPIFYFLHTDEDPGFELDGPHFRLMDFLEPRADEPVLIKDTRNCFTSTNLQRRLVRLGVEALTITGAQMEQCCETTARVAADLGYEVDFVIDATLTFPIPHPDREGEELGTDAIEERTAYALRNRFARVLGTEQAIQELG